MKVLIACEESGTVRDAFTALGHDAISCDLQPSRTEGKHYQGDVFGIINNGFDLLIAHPPCTFLSSSGARWLYDKRYPNRIQDREEAADFFMALMESNIEKIAIENPIGYMSTKYRKPDQIIHPWWFGDNASKATCLWLKGLPTLIKVNPVVPTKHITASNKSYDKWWFDTCKISNLEERRKARSKTFQGIANAMANQWGGLC
jgi:site-specific DNA-cytosine methylase